MPICNMTIEFEVYEDDEMYATACGPYDQAMKEAMNYASQCSGSVRIEQVTRLVVYESTHSEGKTK